MENKKSNPDKHTENKESIMDHLDSPINKDFKQKPDGKSLTNDEDADTDPNKVDNKATFNRNK